MIVRGQLPADNYTITSNSAIEDTSVSLKARMILVYLLSRPPGWVTSAERLAKTISEKDGLSAIKSGLRELEQAGYLTRTRTRDEHGHWRWDHTITDRPSVDNRPVVEASPQVRAPKPRRKPKESAVAAPSENMQSSIGGFSTGGSSVDGQPADISKTEVTKTDSAPPPSSSETRSARHLPAPKPDYSTAEDKELMAKLAKWPGHKYLALAGSRYTWLTVPKTWELTQKYLEEVKAKGWNYSEDGWLKFMEREDEARERRTRGRAYSPDGVPL